MTSSSHRSLFLEAPLGLLLGRQAPPAVAAMLGVALGGLGETAWAGHLLGSEGVAALYLASPFTLLQQAMTAWIAGGAGVLIAFENLLAGIALATCLHFLGRSAIRVISLGSAPISASAAPSLPGVPGIK